MKKNLNYFILTAICAGAIGFSLIYAHIDNLGESLPLFIGVIVMLCTMIFCIGAACFINVRRGKTFGYGDIRNLSEFQIVYNLKPDTKNEWGLFAISILGKNKKFIVSIPLKVFPNPNEVKVHSMYLKKDDRLISLD